MTNSNLGEAGLADISRSQSITKKKVRAGTQARHLKQKSQRNTAYWFALWLRFS